jgi:WD40 repeat protein
MLELMKLGGSGSNSLSNEAGENKNESVLISKASYLVTMLVAANEKTRFKYLISVDSTNLVRAWDLKTQSTVFSYKIPINDRVTAATIDKKSKYLVVGSSSGEAKALNLRSGGVIYDLPSHNIELTCMSFIYGGSSLWLAGGSWQGKLLLWTEPSESNNFLVTVTIRIGHHADILDIVCSSKFIITGSADGKMSIWNIYSGTLKSAVNMP